MEDVYCKIQAVKASGGSLLSPLDAARSAVSLTKDSQAAEVVAAQHKVWEEDDAGACYADALSAGYKAQLEAAGDAHTAARPASGLLGGASSVAEEATKQAEEEGEETQQLEMLEQHSISPPHGMEAAETSSAGAAQQIEAAADPTAEQLSPEISSTSRRSSAGCDVPHEAGTKDAAETLATEDQGADPAPVGPPRQPSPSSPNALQAGDQLQAAGQVDLCLDHGPADNSFCAGQQRDEDQAGSVAGEEPAGSCMESGQADGHDVAALLQAAAMEGLGAAVAAALQEQEGQEQQLQQAQQHASLLQGLPAGSPAAVAVDRQGEVGTAAGMGSPAGDAECGGLDVADSAEGMQMTHRASADLVSGGSGSAEVHACTAGSSA